MKKIIQKENSFQGRRSISYFITAVAAVCLLISSCKKDNDEDAEPMVSAATSIRLVHTSFMRNPWIPGTVPLVTPVDLYVDGVKVNASSMVFPNASQFFPLTSGQKKIEIKDGSGTVVTDTTMAVVDGKQYSIYLKDRSRVNTSNNTITPLKRQMILVVDNNTTIPAAGKAKVRFVNTSSMPLNTDQASISFMLVTKTGNTIAANTLTEDLGGDSANSIFKSEYVSLNAGEITLRAQSYNGTVLDPVNVVDLSTTLEEGKLYTAYVVSTEHTIKTPSKSPIALKIIANN